MSYILCSCIYQQWHTLTHIQILVVLQGNQGHTTTDQFTLIVTLIIVYHELHVSYHPRFIILILLLCLYLGCGCAVRSVRGRRGYDRTTSTKPSLYNRFRCWMWWWQWWYCWGSRRGRIPFRHFGWYWDGRPCSNVGGGNMVVPQSGIDVSWYLIR